MNVGPSITLQECGDTDLHQACLAVFRCDNDDTRSLALREVIHTLASKLSSKLELARKLSNHVTNRLDLFWSLYDIFESSGGRTDFARATQTVREMHEIEEEDGEKVRKTDFQRFLEFTDFYRQDLLPQAKAVSDQIQNSELRMDTIARLVRADKMKNDEQHFFDAAEGVKKQKSTSDLLRCAIIFGGIRKLAGDNGLENLRRSRLTRLKKLIAMKAPVIVICYEICLVAESGEIDVAQTEYDAHHANDLDPTLPIRFATSIALGHVRLGHFDIARGLAERLPRPEDRCHIFLALYAQKQQLC